ncbi:hypothetical protein BSU04_41360 [Caballeronia sordidicola]|uniref:Uncharacterized protein n=1 Tax=Caballeronia sordidicola TaxID=196367 RepID=A0A226WMY7_CABSO|nr:hypothetical protein BSU04_41360 [Caballeronia sordidicola]
MQHEQYGRAGRSPSAHVQPRATRGDEFRNRRFERGHREIGEF